jgi:hypothetical protein
MREKRENVELSKSMKQLENQTKESVAASPSQYPLFRAREGVERRAAWNVVNGPNAKLSCPERATKLWNDVNGKAVGS